jgi:hypothetical protein
LVESGKSVPQPWNIYGGILVSIFHRVDVVRQLAARAQEYVVLEVRDGLKCRGW